MIVQRKITMYQRRAKRVAGPGFHVNVKMDQFQIATMRGKSSIGGIKGQSQLIPSSNQPEMYDIKEQEILVSKRTSGAMYHDGYTHVFSVVNGYDIGNLSLTASAQMVKDKILEEVRFVGIATTEQKADDRLIDQGCVATVGGVVTVLNGGEKPIHPTDKIMLDINLSPARASITREKGIPRQKCRFTFRPADDDMRMIGRALNMCNILDTNDPDQARELGEKIKELKKRYKEKDATLQQIKKDGKGLTGNDLETNKQDEDTARAARNRVDKDIQKAQRNLEDCDGGLLTDAGDGTGRTLDASKLKEFLTNYRHLNELVIGKAMSYAAPGDRFEILLQPRHSL
jgi:DNA repair exonuclease SbcCD ATPase subunit